MNKEEMEKKRNELQIKRDESFQKYTEQISHNSSTYSHFVSGWNACAEEYEKEIERLKNQIVIAKGGLLKIINQFIESDEEESYFYTCAECNSYEFAITTINKINENK